MTFATEARYVPLATDEVLFAQLKLEWKAANPGASTEQYDAAVDVIAELCGV